MEATGFRYGKPSSGHHILAVSKSGTKPSSLSSPACGNAWRFRAKWFCGFGFAWLVIAARRFFSVRTVIAGSVIAASYAAARRGSVSAAALTAATSRVWKAELDHRDRQREYRRRRSQRAPQACVTDHSSLWIAFPASSECGKVDAIAIEAPPRSSAAGLPRWTEQRPGIRLCCRICGRAGRFIDPFPSIPRRM